MRLLVFVVLALFAITQAEEGARLLASKSLLNRYAVEGRDLTLQYDIYNVSSSAALDVELSDDSFPPEDFGIVSGMRNVKYLRHPLGPRCPRSAGKGGGAEGIKVSGTFPGVALQAQ
uniref:Signal sequence receptor subunit 2 n=1 Tax=Saimiri boliviensis boliviensis TaxID=39432 RepID=A0A2K6SYY8_SAIBB